MSQYTGHLRKNPTTGAIEGEIRDQWGWVISITATPSPEGGYVLLGNLGEPPAALRFPVLDDPA